MLLVQFKCTTAYVDIQTQLGGEGRAVLTSSTSTQYSFEQQESDLSIYSRYIVEGIAIFPDAKLNVFDLFSGQLLSDRSKL
ncbi:MAG: hypothetical protein AAGE84_00015 [Cyanobacteria bacterium P01_G01_bin.39]